MKGGKWSRSTVLTFMGVIGGILIIPAVAFLVPGEYARSDQEFSKASSDDLDPHESTCLNDSAQVIPAGVAVCATLTGSWLDGVGPVGRGNHEATAIWTRQAHPPFLVLTSPHGYQHSERLQEHIDFVVCVQPPGGAEKARNASDRMRLDVVRSSTFHCSD